MNNGDVVKYPMQQTGIKYFYIGQGSQPFIEEDWEALPHLFVQLQIDINQN